MPLDQEGEGNIDMVHLQDLILVAKWSIYAMVQNIHHLVPTGLQVAVHLHHHLHLHLHLLLNQTAVSPLTSGDINVVNLNTEVGRVTAQTAKSVSVRKWLKIDTRQQALEN